jgi:hypothetical protein
MTNCFSKKESIQSFMKYIHRRNKNSHRKR